MGSILNTSPPSQQQECNKSQGINNNNLNASPHKIDIAGNLLCTPPIPNTKNKWNFQGDYHNNWEKNLIPLNDKMQSDYHKSMIATKYWIRTILKQDDNTNIVFPEYINIIVAEFYVLPRCSSCGKYDNLWLNIGDGFIGCGRKFYALKSMGGNGCSLTHYNNYKNIDKNDMDNDIDKTMIPKPGPIAVKLGTISANGADVFDYDQPGMIFNAENDQSDDEYDDAHDQNIKKTKKLSLNELKQMLKHWGIEMNRMYLYDSTFHSNQMVLDDTFSKNSYNAFIEEEND